MKRIKFGKNDIYEAVVYGKEEVNKKVLNDMLKAGFNAREGCIEQKYLILNGEADDLNPAKNPYFQSETETKKANATFIIIYKNGVPVGRSIALYDPLYNEYHEQYGRKPVVWLGWPEFKNPEIGEKLIELTLNEAKEFKKKDSSLAYLIGPGRPNEQGIVGLRIAGKFVFFMEPDNPLWYKEVFEREGIDVDDYWTAVRYTKSDLEGWKEMIENSRKFFERTGSGVEIIRINKRSLTKYIKGIYEVYREAWLGEEHIHGRTLTQEEFDYMVKGLKMLVPPYWDNVYIAKENGRTIGISISLPNFNEALEKINAKNASQRMRKEIFFFLKNLLGFAKYKSGRVFIAGVMPDVKGLKRSAISARLTSEAINNFHKNGIYDITMSQLAVPNKDVVVPLLIAHGVDKKSLSGENYKKNIIPILRELAEKGKTSLAAVYKIPI